MKTRKKIVIEIDFDEEPNREYFMLKVLEMAGKLDVGNIVYIAIDTISKARILKDSR